MLNLAKYTSRITLGALAIALCLTPLVVEAGKKSKSNTFSGYVKAAGPTSMEMYHKDGKETEKFKVYKGKPKVDVGGVDIGYDNLPAHWDVTVHYVKGTYHGNEVKLIKEIKANQSTYSGVVTSISKSSINIELSAADSEKKAKVQRFSFNKTFTKDMASLNKTISKGDTVSVKSIGSPKKKFALSVIKSSTASAK